MARSRFQEGTLGVEGKGNRAHYFVRFRVYLADGSSARKKVTVGLVSKLSKREANKQKAAIVARETSQLPEVLAEQRGEMSFERFYHDRFLPLKADWSKAHHKNFTWQMDNYVLPKFGKLAISDVDKVMVQSHLNSLCPKYSRSSIRHVREKLVTVFEEAVDQEFISKNPAKKTVIPTAARAPKKPIMTVEQLIQLIDGINNVRDRAIFLVGTFCAPRTSEVFGLSWKQFHQSAEGEPVENYFLIDQIGYDGEILHTTKTEASKAKVHIGPMTLAAILKLRAEAKDTSPDALLFGSTNKNGRSKKGAPMSAGAWLTKRVQPIADALGIPFKVNFRATRRTACTLVQEHGHSLASAQGFLRHASPGTTADVYTITVPESVKLAVNDYEERVFAARKTPKLVRVK
jgi:integrase